jgi:hypothetical protein
MLLVNPQEQKSSCSPLRWEIARSQKLGVALRFLTEVAPAADVEKAFLAQAGSADFTVEPLLQGLQSEAHISVRVWGMLLLARLVVAECCRTRCAQGEMVESKTQWLLSALEQNAAASSPLDCRLAVAHAVAALLPCFDRLPQSAVLLVAAVLFKLLFDDDSSVREAAAVPATRLCFSSTEEGTGFTRCQFTCCEALSQWIAARRKAEVDPAATSRVLARIICVDAACEDELEAGNEAPRGAKAARDGDDEADEDAEEVLFEAESDNLYAEAAVLRSWLANMGVDDGILSGRLQ